MAGLIVFLVWVLQLEKKIKSSFAEKRFAPPVEFYSAPERLSAGFHLPHHYLENVFRRRGYRLRSFGQPLRSGDFSSWDSTSCRNLLERAQQAENRSFNLEDVDHCVAFRRTEDSFNEPSQNRSDAPSDIPSEVQKIPSEAQNQSDLTHQERPLTDESQPSSASPSESPDSSSIESDDLTKANSSASGPIKNKHDWNDVQIVVMSSTDTILGTFVGSQIQTTEFITLGPELFAQYYGENPILRKVITLGDTPTLCLNALLAVEDKHFLEHAGVSFTGLARALLANLRAGRTAQGGSTITQQLVKNYFLSDEKTFRRKFTEMIMAFLVEANASKDEILETYINLIYMGQNGPFQVRGFAAAAEHYFGKNLHDLNLQECALVAGILNSPGLFNPFKHPDKALQRRAKVLHEMVALNMITEEEANFANASKLPSLPRRSLTEPAPYFVQAVRRELSRQEIDETEGLKVYTSLNLRAQEAALQAVRTGLDQLEEKYPKLKKIKTDEGKSLEAVLISANPKTGDVEALVGGRGFLLSQFNRALDSHRQVGSIMKPFVYLSAFEMLTEDGTPYSPVTIIHDSKMTHRFDRQQWTPENYEKKYLGGIPLFWALKNSINAATVNLGMSIGIENIIDTARRLGIQSPMQAYPSLTLGAFEITPIEVLQAYSVLANLGRKTPLALIGRITDLRGNVLYSSERESQQVIAADSASELVGVMKQVIISGTGRGAYLSGFQNPAAGKTGTTNDKKDAWFAGFTPHHTAIVWVGYDDNTSLDLTGASGAVPIWTSYMKTYGSTFPNDDFPWPETVELATVSEEKQMALGVPDKGNSSLQPVELVFKKGFTPR